MEIGTPVGSGTLLPAAETVKTNSRKSFRASKQPAPALQSRPQRKPLAPVPPPPLPVVPYKVRLVRPPRPNGGAGIRRDHFIAKDHYLEGVNGLVLAWLVTDDPFDVYVDGVLRHSEAGKGWQDRPRVEIEVNGAFAPTDPYRVGITDLVMDVHNKGTRFLYISTADGYSLEAYCDGRLLFAEPRE